MSRSAVVAFVTWVVLTGASVAVVAINRDWFFHLSYIPLGGLLLAMAYGAGLAAVSLRRIIDPSLETPVLAVLGVLALFIMSLFGRKDDNSTTTDPDTTFGPSGSHMGLGWAVISTLIGLGLCGGAIAMTVSFARTERSSAGVASSRSPAPPRSSPVAPVPTAKVAERGPLSVVESSDITSAADLAAAISIARPGLTDVRDAPSAGAVQLARYAAVKLRWRDVAVAKNETSLELAEKDPLAAAGKRLCVAGTLTRIEKQTVAGTELYSARLVTATKDELEVYAVGSTGALVKRSKAKFCGVVTGRLDRGGPATFAVGMFDAAR